MSIDIVTVHGLFMQTFLKDYRLPGPLALAIFAGLFRDIPQPQMPELNMLYPVNLCVVSS